MIRTAPALALLLVAIPSPALADDGLALSGSVRARYETLDGQARAGFGKSDELFALRSILGARYTTQGLELGAELRDSRAYLADAGTPISTGEVNTVELVQAYVKADLGGGATVQAGRFTMSLGSNRFVTDDDYRNTTNGFTGFRVDLGGAGRPQATIFATLPQIRRPDDRAALLDNRVAVDHESFDTQFVGAVATLPALFPGVSADAGYYGLFERDSARTATRDRRLHTLTARLIRNPSLGHLDFEVEYARQFGRISAAATPGADRLPVDAFLFHAEVGHQWAAPWKPRLSLEFEWDSGDGPGRAFGRFDTLYGSRRGDLAPSGIYGAVGRTNIIAPSLRVEVTPGPRTDAFLAVRPMWLASATDAFATSGVRDPAGASGRFAGTQVEGRLRQWLIPDRLRFEGNFAWLAKGAFLKHAPNTPTRADTHYLALALTAFF